MDDRERITTEHEKLEILSDRLRAIVECPTDVIPKWRWRRLLVGDIAVFASVLSDHMRLEEDCGFFEDIARASPRLARRVEKLRSEHDKLRIMLDRVVRGVDTFTDSDGIRASIRELLNTLEQHERAESQAAQDAFLTDDGGQG